MNEAEAKTVAALATDVHQSWTTRTSYGPIIRYGRLFTPGTEVGRGDPALSGSPGKASAQLTSLAIGLLAGEGALSLDDPVLAHLPGLAGTAAAGSEAMTVGHLLRMTAGNGYRWPGRVARVAVRPRQGLAHGRHLRAVRNRAPAARRLREHHRALPGTDHAHPRLRVGTHCARVGISQADRRY
jgi:hypothetical protein